MLILFVMRLSAFFFWSFILLGCYGQSTYDGTKCDSHHCDFLEQQVHQLEVQLYLQAQQLNQLKSQNVSASCSENTTELLRLQNENQRQQIEIQQLKTQIESLLNTTQPSKRCPADFVYLQSVNGCYKLVTDLLEWSAAAARCQSMKNSHLLIVNSAEEQNATTAEFAKYDSGCTYGEWTGGQRIDPQNFTSEFVWRVFSSTDGESANYTYEMHYTNWKPGEPNNYMQTGEACMHLWREENYVWNDNACLNRFCSVCEIDM